MRDRIRRWLALPTVSEVERENKVLKRRIHNLRDALEQTAWRTRMNIRIPDNSAAYHVAMDALVRDMKLEQLGA